MLIENKWGGGGKIKIMEVEVSKKRLFTLLGSICLTLVLAALLLPACAPAPAAPAAPAVPSTVTLVWAEYDPPTAGSVRYITWYANEIDKRSNGRFTADVFTGGVMGSDREQLAVCSSGGCDVACVNPFYFPGEMPLSNIGFLPFAAPPGIDWEALATDALHENNKYVQKELDEWNLVFACNFAQDFYDLMGTVPIRCIEDLDGVKVRCGTDQARVLTQFGVVPVTLSATEWYTAIQTGLVDVICHAQDALTYFKVYEVAKYYTYGFDLGGMMHFMTFNKDSWNALPDEFKEIWIGVRHDAPAVCQWANLGPEFGPPQLENFREYGIEFIEFPKADRDKMIEATGSVWDEWVKRGGEGARSVLNDFLAYGKKAMADYPNGLPEYVPE